MKLSSYKTDFPGNVYKIISKRGFSNLRPSQVKSINAGIFKGENLLVCTPTASGKTLVAEFAFLNTILNEKGKSVYVVPLKALANEKHKEFRQNYPNIKVGISSGDVDSNDSYLERYDLIITTSEKFDSLIRHKAIWINKVRTVIIDEVHLLNDPKRGPALEVLITVLKQILKNLQIIALSATIGNPKELAEWLEAELIEDDWRPIRLDKGVYLDGEVEFE